MEQVIDPFNMEVGPSLPGCKSRSHKAEEEVGQFVLGQMPYLPSSSNMYSPRTEQTVTRSNYLRPTSCSRNTLGPTNSQNASSPVPVVSNQVNMQSRAQSPSSSCVPLGGKFIEETISASQDMNSTALRLYRKRKLTSLLHHTESACSSPKQMQLDQEVIGERKKRFAKTSDALKKLGLWEIAMKTGYILMRNRQLQRELNELKMESRKLMLSIIHNPENTEFKCALLTLQEKIQTYRHPLSK